MRSFRVMSASQSPSKMQRQTAVALVNMPFSYSKYPSIQLGTLSALLKSKGTPVDCHHLNVRFALKIGVPLYEMICEKRALFGEWLFSYLLFRDNPKRAEYPRLFKPVFEQVAKESGHPTSFFEDMATRTAPQFLTWALTAIDWGQYKIVGFTSTFDQNVASLTMAKLIKDLYPDVTIVFGGANYDGEMGLEYFRAFPFIDHVVVGEGEEVFPELVRYLLEGKAGIVPSGVTYREGAAIAFTPNNSLFSDFAKTGPPDYDDYYHLLAELGEAAQGLDRILLYEGSRGCWWGEKHHCTFCGLNAQSMKFRAKSSEQVAREMAYLSSRYDTMRFRLVDNIIDMKYVENLFGRFAADHCDLDVFIETKSNLHKRPDSNARRRGGKVHAAGIGEPEPQSTAGDGQGRDTDAEYYLPQVEFLLSCRGILESLARVSRRDERGLSPPDRPDSIAVPSAPTGGGREILAGTLQSLLHQTTRIWHPHHRSWNCVRVCL